tara:strand:+ start:271 stop:378 length:108 start_codon:yes stop_codon:yes gene_type:complete
MPNKSAKKRKYLRYTKNKENKRLGRTKNQRRRKKK